MVQVQLSYYYTSSDLANPIGNNTDALYILPEEAPWLLGQAHCNDERRIRPDERRIACELRTGF